MSITNPASENGEMEGEGEVGEQKATLMLSSIVQQKRVVYM